jgi:hypothetical protein
MSYKLSPEYVKLKRLEMIIEEYIMEDLYDDRRQLRK